MPEWEGLRRAVALAEECLWTIFSHSLETSLADILVALAVFGGFGGGSRGGRRVNRGSDLRVKVKLNLKEIATGVEKKIKVKKYVTCSKCHGSGAEDDHSSKTCETCHAAVLSPVWPIRS